MPKATEPENEWDDFSHGYMGGGPSIQAAGTASAEGTHSVSVRRLVWREVGVGVGEWDERQANVW